MISKNFLPIINCPTRVTPHSCTLIDNIFCNRVDEVELSGVITTNIFDHYPVFAREKFPTLPEDSISINYRVFSDENLSNFKNSLQDINWNPVLINDDANQAYDLFQSTLLTVFNKHSPIQTKNISSVGKSKPWITPGILSCNSQETTPRKKACQNLERFLTDYHRHRNLLTKVTRTAREQYYHNLLESSSGNSKKVWSNINTILAKNRKASSTSIKLNGIIINEPKVIASSFNSYFNSIPSTLSNNINNNIVTFENYLVDPIPEAENFQLLPIPEITEIITNLMQSNSVGWDNIPTIILKSNINILAPILSNLINKSLAIGLFPKYLKRAKILPIFKIKDNLDITNYRPISILPVISKVYKKVFYNRLYNYFSVNNLLSSSQFVFRSGTSIEHALLKLSDILKLFDQKKVAIANLWISVTRLTVCIIIFYYPNSNDMVSTKLHCNRLQQLPIRP